MTQGEDELMRSPSSQGTDPDEFKPDTPTMGGIEQTGIGTWNVWTGGVPNNQWTGLLKSTPSHISPSQYRPTSVTSQAKSRAYRVAGLEQKFGRNDDFQQFQRRVKKHLVNHGMDTIVYIPDPSGNKMINIIDKYALYSLRKGVDTANLVMDTHFDKYNKSNSNDAVDFLLNSVDDELEKRLSQTSFDEYSFAAYWFRLVHLVKSVSIKRFETIRQRI